MGRPVGRAPISRVLHPPCKDCGKDTSPCTGNRRHVGCWQHYLVTNRVWERAGMRPKASSTWHALSIVSVVRSDPKI